MGGCTANDAFHLALKTVWTLFKQLDCHNRYGTRDRVWIYGVRNEGQRPILNRNKPTAWLNDMQIGNIQGILWESLKQDIWRNNEGKLSVNFIYPLTLEILLDNVKDQCRYLLRAKRKHVNTVTFITINIGRNRWTPLIIDNQTVKKSYLYRLPDPFFTEKCPG